VVLAYTQLTISNEAIRWLGFPLGFFSSGYLAGVGSFLSELYPTRLRAIGAGFGSAWLRIASSIGPLLVGWVVGSYSINYVFVAFGIVLAVGGILCLLFAPETKGRVLEELSP